MSSTRVGINGFGRIGRNFLRAHLDRGGDFEIVAVNDIGDTRTMAHLLKYDSVLGPFAETVAAEEDGIVVAGRKIDKLTVRDPKELPWGDLGVDIALESTGLFTKRDQAQAHLEAGAAKVVISAPATDPDVTIVLGVNDDDYDPAAHAIVSNASCTTNCVGPMAKVLHDAFTIEQGFMTTIHAYTNDQRVLDLPHEDLRRARAAAINLDSDFDRRRPRDRPRDARPQGQGRRDGDASARAGRLDRRPRCPGRRGRRRSRR